MIGRTVVQPGPAAPARSADDVPVPFKEFAGHRSAQAARGADEEDGAQAASGRSRS